MLSSKKLEKIYNLPLIGRLKEPGKQLFENWPGSEVVENNRLISLNRCPNLLSRYLNLLSLRKIMNDTTLKPELIGTKSQVKTNKVIRNTYMLLSMTLIFCGINTSISLVFNLPHPGLLLTLGGYFGLLFLTTKFRDSTIGLACVFALIGFMGFTLGPVINSHLAMNNGAQLVMMAMGSTGAIFLGLSGYALISRKDVSFIGSFLLVGILVAFFAGLAAIFFEMPALSLAASSMFVLLMSGLILHQTSSLIHGGETNYIMATVTLYVSIFNLFTSLLNLLGFMNSEE
jgi:modulator of FtsH protease